MKFVTDRIIRFSIHYVMPKT